MKIGIVLTLLFAVTVFATSANAQQIKISGSKTMVLKGKNIVSNAPAIELAAGERIRVQVIPAAGDEKTFAVLMGTRAEFSTTAIPCSGSSTTARRRIEGARGNDRIVGGQGRDLLIGGSGGDLLIGGSTTYEQQQYFEIQLKPVYITSYQTSAGTCQLLYIKLSNGSEYRGVVRFR